MKNMEMFLYYSLLSFIDLSWCVQWIDVHTFHVFQCVSCVCVFAFVFKFHQFHQVSAFHVLLAATSLPPRASTKTNMFRLCRRVHSTIKWNVGKMATTLHRTSPLYRMHSPCMRNNPSTQTSMNRNIPIECFSWFHLGSLFKMHGLNRRYVSI